MGVQNQGEMRRKGIEPGVGEGANDAEERGGLCMEAFLLGAFQGTIPLLPLGLHSGLKGRTSNR